MYISWHKIKTYFRQDYKKSNNATIQHLIHNEHISREITHNEHIAINIVHNKHIAREIKLPIIILCRWFVSYHMTVILYDMIPDGNFVIKLSKQYYCWCLM
jgi:hypothetical protein